MLFLPCMRPPHAGLQTVWGTFCAQSIWLQLTTTELYVAMTVSVMLYSKPDLEMPSRGIHHFLKGGTRPSKWHLAPSPIIRCANRAHTVKWHTLTPSTLQRTHDYWRVLPHTKRPSRQSLYRWSMQFEKSSRIKTAISCRTLHRASSYSHHSPERVIASTCNSQTCNSRHQLFLFRANHITRTWLFGNIDLADCGDREGWVFYFIRHLPK